MQHSHKLDFLIIGAQKCGTTSLFHYLAQHPGIMRPKKKEIHYFDFNYDKGTDWLFSFFPDKIKKPTKILLGEATPYYFVHPHVPARVHQLYPDVKLIALMRNPVERAYSHYHGRVRNGFEKRSFAEAVRNEEQRLAGEYGRMVNDEHYHSPLFQNFSYLARGRYYEQIMNWLEYFDLSNFLFIKSEDFFSDPGKTYLRVLKFLDIPEFSPDFSIKFRQASYNRMGPDIRMELNSYFAEHNEKLISLLGEPFRWD